MLHVLRKRKGILALTITVGSFINFSYADSISNSFATKDVANKELPSGVTVITKEEIKALGITNIVDVMRLIPGMSVTQTATSRQNVSYHGTNSIFPRRTMVLVDGMSLHRVGNSSITWFSFPVSVDDIERVEIYRNHVYPKSGAKTLQATVNIITRHPADVTKNELVVREDTNDISQQSALLRAEVGNTQMYARFENSHNAGFDRSTETNAKGVSTNVIPIDGLSDKKANVRINSQLSDSTALDVSFGAITGDIDISTRDSGATGYRKEAFDSYFFNSSININEENDEYKISAYSSKLDKTKEWHTCYPLVMFTDELRAMNDANPLYANTLLAGKTPKGGTPKEDELAKKVLLKVASLGAIGKGKECGNINENFVDTRRVVNFENSHMFSESLLLTSGYEYQNNYYDGATIAGGRIDQESHNIHATAHLVLNDYLGLSGGGNYHSIKTNEDRNGSFSEHLGFNYDYLANQTAKLVFSKTSREPDPLENYTKWSYFMTGFSVPFDGKTEGYFYRTTYNTGSKVTAEDYRTVELDFSGTLFNKHLEYDLKVFDEKMDHLISQDLIFTKYEPTNDSQTRLRGYELLVKYHVNSNLNVIIGGSDINNDSTNINEKSLALDNAGYVSMIYTSGNNSASISYYGSNGLYGNSFDRLEANYKRTFPLFGFDAFGQLRARYEPSDFVSSLGAINASGTGRDGSSAVMEYSNKYSVMAAFGVSF